MPGASLIRNTWYWNVARLDEATLIFLGISRLKGVGFKTLRELGGVDAIAQAFSQDPLQFCEKVTREKHSSDIGEFVLKRGEEAALMLSEQSIHLVRTDDIEYPNSFHDLGKQKPLWFFYRGDITLLKIPSVAIVGTRTPSSCGDFLTKYAVTAMKELNLSIVSGLAKGIDEIAHEWALSVGLPNISILGTGLLKTYPAKNAELANSIVNNGGLLISEYMPPAQPSAETFVWRNRLQAALARCVIAPEWKRSSGTAHTIRFAKSLNKVTVNLTLTGKKFGPDHGEADVAFEIPSQHLEFIEMVRSIALCENDETDLSMQQKKRTKASQPELF
jgi:DNA processing protein